MKPSSRIRKTAKSRLDAKAGVAQIKAICSKLRMNVDDWLLIFFETGCQFAEAKWGYHAQEIITDTQSRFWNQYLHFYLDDDLTLMEVGIQERIDYEEQKYRIPETVNERDYEEV